MRLSILIPTIIDRTERFNALSTFFHNQIDLFDLNDQVEVISLLDNKELSIGEKRQHLYEMARGEYSVMWDDDDGAAHNALPLIMEALSSNPDCVTYKESCNIDGEHKTSNHSNKYVDWGENIDGFDYVRTVFFKDVIRTALCLQAGVADMRYAEDIDFARRLKPLITTEVHIDEWIYFYHHVSSNHNERYGIT